MKEVKQAIVLVDAYRRPDRKRNTAGRYRVGAKTEKEAEELVQKAIGFGSVEFYCWEEGPAKQRVKYKEVVKEKLQSEKSGADFSQEPARHACSPIKEGV